jgi:hypothetical protein
VRTVCTRQTATAHYLDVPLAYMSCEILAQAVAKVGLDKDKLRNEIASDTFDTIDGPVKFDGVQNVSTPTMFLQLQDGKARRARRRAAQVSGHAGRDVYCHPVRVAVGTRAATLPDPARPAVDLLRSVSTAGDLRSD